jgi:hypothetical protein
MNLSLRQTIAILGVFFAAILVTQIVIDSIGGGDRMQFSKDELSLREALDGKTEQLLLPVSAAEAAWPGHWYDCTEPGNPAVEYRVDENGSVTGVKSIESTSLSPALSEYCDSDTGSWFTTALALARDKERFMIGTQAERDLADGSEDELKTIVETEAARLGDEYMVSDARWLATEGLGQTSYGFSYVAVDSYGREFEYFRYRLRRDIVSAEVAMKFPRGSMSDEQTLALALQFDRRLESRISSIAAVRR